MTRLARALLAVYLVAFVWLAYVSAVCLHHNDPGQAAAFYATATLVAVAGGRERQHAAALQAAAVRDPRPYPNDLDAVMRAELARTCRCERWWTTFGTDHDPTCTQQTSATNTRHDEQG
ncbi:hypothetical protein J7E96_28320 [Streptomyces sp. ISL-96]|uniref:hypothetical protein n=1 Tax=Streptomyces sp. ISL-96 TaxID=2819191 RepID=UPI001BEB2D1F|nr:hypothetical protein [Streptomyces sp. ISL-96]MBT2492346.1 hypothetical protein [Streptomyces sp. ISL-96]